MTELYLSIYDEFVGIKIGEYTTLEGHQGYVLQQLGNKVVHVYRLKHLKHLPSLDETYKRLTSK